MAYDRKTAVPDPSYILQVMVTDLDNPQSLYQCSLSEGFGLESLKEACKAKAPEADRDTIAASVQSQASSLEGQRMQLVVTKAKASNNFLSLVVGSLQPLSQA